MANLKNITELPVAESAEGLNLIVNDNGTAKQIPASAVGAQADFAVTDETSPAFIKNKPAVAQSDWSIEDSSNPAFIKNKPFYDTREFETVTITFDGDSTGKEFVPFYEDGSYGVLKISDKVVDYKELIGGTYSTHDYDSSWSSEIFEDMIYFQAYGIADVDNMFIIVYPEGVNDEMPFTEGIWTYCGLEDGAPVFYTTEISWNSVVSGEFKTIEPKYVKDMYYSTQFENVEILAETTQTSDNGWIYLQEPMAGLVENGVYTVNWNGVKYICYCNYDMNNNKYQLWSDAFCLTYAEWFYQDGYYAEIEVYDNSTSVTLSIIGSYEEVKTIEPKYIPYEVWNETNNAFNTANNASNVANNAQTAANNAQTTANNAQTTASNKMDKNNPTGSGSFSMNRKSGTTIGEYSHAEGNKVTASGYASHAEGYGTIASGEFSHAEGESTQATSVNCHAEGKSTKATSAGSHAEGDGTTASSSASHAEGFNTTASAPYSHAEGCGTTACGDFSHQEGQHVQGKWNIINGFYAHIVGNGASDTSRSNAHTLDWEGNAWYQGTVEGTGFILASPNGTKYKITVADDGTLSAVAV